MRWDIFPANCEDDPHALNRRKGEMTIEQLELHIADMEANEPQAKALIAMLKECLEKLK
jgi:hypothetical protein